MSTSPSGPPPGGRAPEPATPITHARPHARSHALPHPKPTRFVVPEAFAASYALVSPTGQDWLAGAPALAEAMMERWGLRIAGPTMYGMASLVAPVTCADGRPAALKLQEVREETAGSVAALRAWDGDGVVRLLDHDPATASMLLERLDAARPLSAGADDATAMPVIADLLVRMTALPAPAGLRHLADIAADMVEQTAGAVGALREPAEQKLLRYCADAVAELLSEPGDRLLHWDLHGGNVLAGGREPWLAIDPEALAGDPGFELLPSLDDRWPPGVTAGEVSRTGLRRFDLLTEALDLDRQRAVGWTLGRVLQNGLWDIEDGKHALEPTQVALATALIGR
ncbi:aminoglycoside phosphotransferase family protein [Streptomyces sp. HSW2009]|uniref:aminoglycoside phosphotransferase family protein n=1 Tax=Streptomyces sp. HSW2009 TaxID=3142890 RepID=UPI0032EA9CC2